MDEFKEYTKDSSESDNESEDNDNDNGDGNQNENNNIGNNVGNNENETGIVIEYFGNNDNGNTLKILCYMIKNNQMDKFLKYKNFLCDKNDKNEIDSDEIDINKRDIIIDFLNKTENNEIIDNVFGMIENIDNNINIMENENENNAMENDNENINENENKENAAPRIIRFSEKKDDNNKNSDSISIHTSDIESSEEEEEEVQDIVINYDNIKLSKDYDNIKLNHKDLIGLKEDVNDCLLFVKEEKKKIDELKNDIDELIEWADTQPYISNKCFDIIVQETESYEHDNVRTKIALRNKGLGNERIVANGWQRLIEKKKILNERGCNLVLKLLQNVEDIDNNNQSGVGFVGALTKGLKLLRG